MPRASAKFPGSASTAFRREALVKFQHAPHVRARIACATCHGDMTQATTAELLVKHNMGTCLSCHRQIQGHGGLRRMPLLTGTRLTYGPPRLFQDSLRHVRRRAAASCGRKTDKLIPLLVPEHEIVPGEEQWHPAVCAECGAGCGTLVRIMEGVRTVERNGEQVRERIAAIKKIEGNPLDPISGGRLCARGQASVQSLYHPDRLRGPMKRTGERGQAQFAAVSWDEAIGQAAEKIAKARAADPARIVFLTGPQAGTRSLAIQRFTQALGAPAPVVCSIADFAVERQAAEMVFGWKGLPVYDLARAHYALGVGADFLGGWASPVYYARQFGSFRQGRREVRGRLVQAESRLSITAAAADRWLPLRPGSEPQFLAAVGRMLLDARLARNAAKRFRSRSPAAFQAADPAALLAACGLEEKRVREVVQELGESEAPLVLAGASIVHSNSLDAIVASHYINLMLGNVGKPGGVLRARAGRRCAPRENHRVAEALAARAGGAHRRREPGHTRCRVRAAWRTPWRAPNW